MDARYLELLEKEQSSHKDFAVYNLKGMRVAFATREVSAKLNTLSIKSESIHL